VAGNATGKSVLVIDDEPVLCEFAASVLGKHGFRVITTTDSRRWRAACGDVVPDLVILDLFMPEPDGIETMRALRETWPTVRIVAVSGSVPIASKSALAAASRLGADRALPKPLDETALLRTVRELLEPRG